MVRSLCVAMSLLVAPFVAFAHDAMDKQTIKFVLSLQDEKTGAFRVTADGKPSLRACNGGVKILRTLKADVPKLDMLKGFVASCYDATNGTFAEPGGATDVAINAVGILLVTELGLDKSKFVGAMNYIGKEAKTWEDLRIAAAAVEAWGLKDLPFSVLEWDIMADDAKQGVTKEDGRFWGGLLAFRLRMGFQSQATLTDVNRIILAQKSDGGWGGVNAKSSDLETCYRVIRALKMAGQKDAITQESYAKVAKFVNSCRDKDGGYGVQPKGLPTMSGTYYAVIIQAWLK